MLNAALLVYGMVVPALVSTYILFPDLQLAERIVWTALLAIVVVPLAVYLLNATLTVPINTAGILAVATFINVGGGAWLVLGRWRRRT